MEKKSIFITGAARGIGYATAQLFASKGWFVGLADLNEAELKTLAGELGTDNCSVHPVDVTKVDELEKAIDHFGTQTGGTMNVLFNNAGILFSGGFEKVPLDRHKAVIDVNVIGQMNVTCVALELLKNTYRSTIINMCSASSLYGNPDLTAYAASKSAVKSLTESWNMLFKKYGIHVADIIPSYVKTDMLKGKEDTIYAKDIKLSPAGIAQSVWNATCSKKVHHVIGADARLLSFAKRALPEFLLASILKRRFYKEALLKN